MQKAPLNKESTVIGFRLITRQKMESTLSITCFDDKQCDAIQSTYLPTFLSKMGINQKTARTVRSGPARYSGMAVPKMCFNQGVGANKLMIGPLGKDDSVGREHNQQLTRCPPDPRQNLMASTQSRRHPSTSIHQRNEQNVGNQYLEV
jgi:hypothetical protein